MRLEPARSGPPAHHRGWTAASSLDAPSASAALIQTRGSSESPLPGGYLSRSMRNAVRPSARPVAGVSRHWTIAKNTRIHRRQLALALNKAPPPPTLSRTEPCPRKVSWPPHRRAPVRPRQNGRGSRTLRVGPVHRGDSHPSSAGAARRRAAECCIGRFRPHGNPAEE